MKTVYSNSFKATLKREDTTIYLTKYLLRSSENKSDSRGEIFYDLDSFFTPSLVTENRGDIKGIWDTDKKLLRLFLETDKPSSSLNPWNVIYVYYLDNYGEEKIAFALVQDIFRSEDSSIIVSGELEVGSRNLINVELPETTSLNIVPPQSADTEFLEGRGVVLGNSVLKEITEDSSLVTRESYYQYLRQKEGNDNYKYTNKYINKKGEIVEYGKRKITGIYIYTYGSLREEGDVLVASVRNNTGKITLLGTYDWVEIVEDEEGNPVEGSRTGKGNIGELVGGEIIVNSKEEGFISKVDQELKEIYYNENKDPEIIYTADIQFSFDSGKIISNILRIEQASVGNFEFKFTRDQSWIENDYPLYILGPTTSTSDSRSFTITCHASILESDVEINLKKPTDIDESEIDFVGPDKQPKSYFTVSASINKILGSEITTNVVVTIKANQPNDDRSRFYPLVEKKWQSGEATEDGLVSEIANYELKIGNMPLWNFSVVQDYKSPGILVYKKVGKDVVEVDTVELVYDNTGELTTLGSYILCREEDGNYNPSNPPKNNKWNLIKDDSKDIPTPYFEDINFDHRYLLSKNPEEWNNELLELGGLSIEDISLIPLEKSNNINNNTPSSYTNTFEVRRADIDLDNITPFQWRDIIGTSTKSFRYNVMGRSVNMSIDGDLKTINLNGLDLYKFGLKTDSVLKVEFDKVDDELFEGIDIGFIDTPDNVNEEGKPVLEINSFGSDSISVYFKLNRNIYDSKKIQDKYSSTNSVRLGTIKISPNIEGYPNDSKVLEINVFFDPTSENSCILCNPTDIEKTIDERLNNKNFLFFDTKSKKLLYSPRVKCNKSPRVKFKYTNEDLETKYILNPYNFKFLDDYHINLDSIGYNYTTADFQEITVDSGSERPVRYPIDVIGKVIYGGAKNSNVEDDKEEYDFGWDLDTTDIPYSFVAPAAEEPFIESENGDTVTMEWNASERGAYVYNYKFRSNYPLRDEDITIDYRRTPKDGEEIKKKITGVEGESDTYNLKLFQEINKDSIKDTTFIGEVTMTLEISQDSIFTEESKDKWREYLLDYKYIPKVVKKFYLQANPASSSEFKYVIPEFTPEYIDTFGDELSYIVNLSSSNQELSIENLNGAYFDKKYEKGDREFTIYVEKVHRNKVFTDEEEFKKYGNLKNGVGFTAVVTDGASQQSKDFHYSQLGFQCGFGLNYDNPGDTKVNYYIVSAESTKEDPIISIDIERSYNVSSLGAPIDNNFSVSLDYYLRSNESFEFNKVEGKSLSECIEVDYEGTWFNGVDGRISKEDAVESIGLSKSEINFKLKSLNNGRDASKIERVFRVTAKEHPEYYFLINITQTLVSFNVSDNGISGEVFCSFRADGVSDRGDDMIINNFTSNLPIESLRERLSFEFTNSDVAFESLSVFSTSSNNYKLTGKVGKRVEKILGTDSKVQLVAKIDGDIVWASENKYITQGALILKFYNPQTSKEWNEEDKLIYRSGTYFPSLYFSVFGRYSDVKAAIRMLKFDGNVDKDGLKPIKIEAIEGSYHYNDDVNTPEPITNISITADPDYTWFFQPTFTETEITETGTSIINSVLDLKFTIPNPYNADDLFEYFSNLYYTRKEGDKDVQYVYISFNPINGNWESIGDKKVFVVEKDKNESIQGYLYGTCNAYERDLEITEVDPTLEYAIPSEYADTNWLEVEKLRTEPYNVQDESGNLLPSNYSIYNRIFSVQENTGVERYLRFKVLGTTEDKGEFYLKQRGNKILELPESLGMFVTTVNYLSQPIYVYQAPAIADNSNNYPINRFSSCFKKSVINPRYLPNTVNINYLEESPYIWRCRLNANTTSVFNDINNIKYYIGKGIVDDSRIISSSIEGENLTISGRYMFTSTSSEQPILYNILINSSTLKTPSEVTIDNLIEERLENIEIINPVDLDDFLLNYIELGDTSGYMSDKDKNFFQPIFESIKNNIDKLENFKKLFNKESKPVFSLTKENYSGNNNCSIIRFDGLQPAYELVSESDIRSEYSVYSLPSVVRVYLTIPFKIKLKDIKVPYEVRVKIKLQTSSAELGMSGISTVYVYNKSN